MSELFDHYELILSSDSRREGMVLELWDKRGRALAEVFYSDFSRQMSFSSFESILPWEAVEWLIKAAKEALPPRSAKMAWQSTMPARASVGGDRNSPNQLRRKRYRSD